ncbi:signal peptide peptidase SppA [Novosphingobium mangrovi (ex Huang et al. 2023)]|uniref:Signal peptide peptidase SppA n=1 Tax=Novosphingobium mangrovi (ex Huang et al. 2023) TaxID=2976432 RepID=A0ABT2I4J0_9SPHN|nr:signal peptide peptidase SppA [Novosphingobium mangrovi (ex Huang et al. 2023)]MCT2399735.1 signal peptide peptidase SppA [Novosphingobium mangrovi (ex Huang et al. 2023)]
MKFASKIWKLLVGIKDALALLFLVLFFSAMYVVLSVRPSAGYVEKGALLLDLDGVVVEEKSDVDPLDVLIAGEAPTREFQAHDIERALRLAAKDERVKVVVLDLSRFMGGRFVHLKEIGAAMDAVRKAGKPVLTFAPVYLDDGVQLAAHSSEAWLDPMGEAFVAGPGGNMNYYKGLIDRLKINAHVYRVGTYKSFVEPYLRSDMSPAARKAYEDVYGALWDAWKADVKKARPKADFDKLASDPVGAMKAAGGDFAKGAKAAGVVDRLGDKTEFDQRVAKLAGKSSDDDDLPYAHTSLATWLAANPEKKPGKAIAVVTVAGEIVDGDAGPGKAGGDRIAKLLDDNIDEGYKALVVRIDSPGGSATAAERIRRAIQRWRDAKIPVVVSMGNMAASGGYWVSTPAQKVFAEPATITGSIGVFAVIPSFEKTLADFGVTSDGVRTTPLSGQPDIFGGFTPELNDLLQSTVENTYGKFIDLVAKARGRTPEQIDAVAQGRVWPGAEARELGLVDEMGDLDAALAYAAKAGGVGNEKWHAQYLRKAPDAFSTFIAGLETRPRDDALAHDFAGLVAARQRAQAGRALGQLENLLGTRGVQAYCLECPPLPGQGVRPKDLSLVRGLLQLTR